MERKVAAFQNKGMTRDTSISKASNELAFENFNIRITARDHDTLLSVTNERGNAPVTLYKETYIRDKSTGNGEVVVTDEIAGLKGTLIGYSVLNSYLILFTTESGGNPSDHIYRIHYVPGTVNSPERWSVYYLYDGNLNFSVEYPIECLANYESERVQKVYWVDGINQPRFINISDGQLDSTVNLNGMFNFIASVNKFPELNISRQFSGISTLPSGVIQYICTYSNELGQETNLIYRSPLYYSSYYNRGAASDVNPNNSFSIEISNMDTAFDYINIYRIIRTSENGTPTASKIAQISTSEVPLTYIDTGGSLSSIDPTALLYIGGRSIVPNTLAQKDGTLFIGNYKIETASSDPDILKAARSGLVESSGINNNLCFSLSSEDKNIPYVEGTGYYPYNCLLNYSDSQIKTFKGGEKYRFAIRFMKDTGELSTLYWIGDQENNCYPEIDLDSDSIKRAYVSYNIPRDLLDEVTEKGFTHAELMVAEASLSDRKILAQGVVCPTLFNLKQRFSDAPFSISSWYFRPMGGNMAHLHFDSLPLSDSLYSEVQCSKPVYNPNATDPEGKPVSSEIEKFEGQITPFTYAGYFGKSYNSKRYRILVKNNKSLGIIWNRNIKWVLEYSTSTISEIKDSEKNTEKNISWDTISSESHRGTNWMRIMEEFIRPDLYDWGFTDGVIPSNKRFSEDWVQTYQGNNGWYDITGGVYYDFETGEIIHRDPNYALSPIGSVKGSMGFDYSNVYSQYYFIDQSICTFHSPEIAEGTWTSFDNLNCKFRIVGLAPITSTIVDYNIAIKGNRASTSGGMSSVNLSNPIGEFRLDGLLTWPLWADATDTSVVNNLGAFLIYPWHKTGSIISNRDGDYSILDTKQEANLRYSLLTKYLPTQNFWTPENGIETVRVSASDEAQLIGVNTQWGLKNYQATGDWLISASVVFAPDSQEEKKVDPVRDQGYPLYITPDTLTINSSIESILNSDDDFSVFPSGYNNKEGIYKQDDRCYDPVSISFKSGKHAVFSFKSSSDKDKKGQITILPYIKVTDLSGSAEDNEITINQVPEIPKDENKELYLPWVNQVDTDEGAVKEIDFYPYDDSDPWFNFDSYENGNLKIGVPYAWFESNEDYLNEAAYILAQNSLQTILYNKEGNDFSPVPENLPAPFSIDIQPDYDQESENISATITFRKSIHSTRTKISWIGSGQADGISGDTITDSDSVSFNLGTVPVTASGEWLFSISMQSVSSNSSYWNDSKDQCIGSIIFTVTDTAGGLEWNISSNISYDPIPPQESDVIIISGKAEEEIGRYYISANNSTWVYSDRSVTEAHPKDFSYSQDVISIENSMMDFQHPFLYVAELYNDFTDSTGEVHDNRYGGITEAAIESNTFVPAGPMTKLIDKTGRYIDTLVAYTGDTYVSRYDILKTLPYSNSAENQVTEIASVMLETHINIDGRTDTNRGNMNLLGISQENFNVFNSVYSTDNNFFSGTILPSSRFSTDYFPSQITWTLQKSPNEAVDHWTNITLASIQDLDGDKGPIRAIRRFKNNLIAFQDKGIAEILFNSRTQLATTAGVPIEIANSGKVDGKRYITDKAGCINKWSIVETSNGIYFIDNINSSISIFNGSAVQSLSDAKGFKDWIGRNNSTDVWNPRDFNNFVTFWDRVNDDVYFLRGNEGENHDVLCYNEQLQQFVSFYNYGQVPMMVNLQDKFVAFKNVNMGDGTSASLWKQGEGLYSHIFNEYQNFYTLYRVTPDPYSDKIFTNLTYRADMFDMNQENDFMPGEGLLTGNTFDILEVWNEYQGNKVDLKFTFRDSYPDKRRKFRIWRMDIPRDRKGTDNPHGFNRIRNPWIYLKLEKDNSGLQKGHNERMEFHDLAVGYFE